MKKIIPTFGFSAGRNLKDILATLEKTAAELEMLAEEKLKEADQLNLEIECLEYRVDSAMNEAGTAKDVAFNIRNNIIGSI